MVKPIVLYSAPGGPNPFKVMIILEELNVPLELKIVAYGDLKAKPYTDINPNGRAPVIEDPNTGVTIWESGAIYEYLIEQYDTEKKLDYTTTPEKYLLKQWLFFQASGQGPYFGQAAWFNLFHPEKLPSAQKRYMDEINRVVGVLDGVLSQSKSGWLVGDKCTYADLVFVMWNQQIDAIFKDFPGNWDIAKYPHFKTWAETMLKTLSVKKALEAQKKVIADAYSQ